MPSAVILLLGFLKLETSSFLTPRVTLSLNGNPAALTETTSRLTKPAP